MPLRSNSNVSPSTLDSRLMMQTRVAVRDKTPHRFHVVPLREVSTLALAQTDISSSSPTTPPNLKLHRDQSSSVGSYSYSRGVSPIQFKNKNGLDVKKLRTRQDSHLLATQRVKLDARSLSSESRRAFAELDINRNVRVAMAKAGLVSKPTDSKKSVPLRSLAPRVPSFPEDIPESPVPLGNPSHISEISQLFSSDNTASGQSLRRNRSMTVTSIRSDTSTVSGISQENESKLKRRRAIYRESSCMPYSARSQSKNWDDKSSLANQLGHVNNGIDFNLTPEISGPLLRPPFELKQVTRPDIPRPGLQPVRALRLFKQPGTRRTAVNSRETVYPRAVLDLLKDVDEAIIQWAQS